MGTWAGMGFVVFTVLAFVVGGETPTLGDPVEEVVSYYDGDRGQVLVSSFLFAVGLGFWVWFAATVANNFRERGQGRVGATIIGAVAVFVSVQFVATGLNAVLAHSVAGEGDAGVTRALFELTWTLDVLAAVPSAIFFLAAGLGFLRTGMIPTWLSWAALRRRGAVRATSHELGERRLLVSDGRIRVHPDSGRAALDPRDEHRSRAGGSLPPRAEPPPDRVNVKLRFRRARGRRELALDLVDELFVQVEQAPEETHDQQQVLGAVRQRIQREEDPGRRSGADGLAPYRTDDGRYVLVERVPLPRRPRLIGFRNRTRRRQPVHR